MFLNRSYQIKKYDTIFLDRDGTLNFDPGYINSLDDFKFHDLTFDALKNLKIFSERFCIITNQSGVARGIVDSHILSMIHDHILNIFFDQGLNLLGIYHCTDHPDNPTFNRKPGIGMFEKAADDHNINLKKSLMIGDSRCDIEAAKNCNMESVLVLTGNGEKTKNIPNINPTYISKDLNSISKNLMSSK
tara:strand:+ start:212 stop:778 length:567 start_codon:yes stop_codon:yes gene_type:complete